jgi:putative ABC transport system substrate-binding protein
MTYSLAVIARRAATKLQPSCPRKRASRVTRTAVGLWIPAFAGMTDKKNARLMRRGAAVVLLFAAVLAPLTAGAQTAPSKPPEVCLLYPGPEAALPERTDLVNLGLADARLEVGRDVVLLAHAATFDQRRMQQAAADCVARDVRVIVAVASAVAAARSATRTIPIVALDLETDPIAAGLVESLARPGGNVTGIYFDFPDFSAKQLELLGEAVPGLKRVGVLWDPNTNTAQLPAVRALGAARGLELVEQQMTDGSELPARFQAFAEARAQAVLVLSTPLVLINRKQFADLALARRLPAITMFPEFAEAGGLMAYGPKTTVLYRPIGELAGKIVRGAKPADLPVERPARMSLVINLATAKALGMTVPPQLLGRADDVIE